jgi:hypothetical protein
MTSVECCCVYFDISWNGPCCKVVALSRQWRHLIETCVDLSTTLSATRRHLVLARIIDAKQTALLAVTRPGSARPGPPWVRSGRCLSGRRMFRTLRCPLNAVKYAVCPSLAGPSRPRTQSKTDREADGKQLAEVWSRTECFDFCTDSMLLVLF